MRIAGLHKQARQVDLHAGRLMHKAAQTAAALRADSLPNPALTRSLQRSCRRALGRYRDDTGGAIGTL